MLLNKILPFALLAAQAWAVQAADPITYYREGQRIDPQEVASVLSSGVSRPAPIPTRSIRLLPEPGQAPAVAALPVPDRLVADPPVAADADGSALALPVRFGFDSAEIEPAALAQLDAVAEGIALLPEGQAVLIEGHTDARGTPAYNLALSRRRAEAVRLYLVSAHGIDAARLKAVGYGPYKPLADSEPTAARNRRVQFRGLPQQFASAGAAHSH